MRFVTCALLTLGLCACTTHHQDVVRPPASEHVSARGVLDTLHASGPKGFAMVTPGLYRGGKPSVRHLELLRDLGVDKIVDLRREAMGQRNAERAEARRLGMAYVEYPFYGVFGVDLGFLDRLMVELTPEQGAVYVHCGNGGARTSLVAALYRVVHEGWSSDEAWQREAVDFGYRRSRANREFELTFQEYALEHEARMETARTSEERRRATTAAVRGGPGSDRRHASP